MISETIDFVRVMSWNEDKTGVVEKYPVAFQIVDGVINLYDMCTGEFIKEVPRDSLVLVLKED